MAHQSPEGAATELPLDGLIQGYRHLPRERAAMMVQAAVVCLEDQSHTSGVRLPVDGAFTATFAVTWTERVTGTVRRFWNDLEEATQHGAYAVAILLIRAITGYTIIERSRKGTGFDWWLGTEDNLFQGKARLEVSGILRGSTKRINSRLTARVQQTMRSDDGALPAYIIVIEFGRPQAKVVQR